MLQGLSAADRPLSCYYETNEDPLLILAPAKVEELTDKSLGLRFYHHVISDAEIEVFKRIASKKVTFKLSLKIKCVFNLPT